MFLIAFLDFLGAWALGVDRLLEVVEALDMFPIGAFFQAEVIDEVTVLDAEAFDVVGFVWVEDELGEPV